MKQYFTKYLPVEGEIKEGDIFLHKKLGSCTLLGNGWVLWAGGKTNYIPFHEDKKAKLFLCSRDIQVGDTVTWFGKYTWGYLQKIFIGDEKNLKIFKERSKEPYGKVIGEVSPNAIWVNEGMEFEKDDIETGGGFILFWHEQLTHWTKLAPFEQEIADDKIHSPYIKFKCPTCNTFH